MLRKLRIKFVALLMAAVAVVMTVLFAAICAISWQQSTAELNDALGDVLEMVTEHIGEPDGDGDFIGDGEREGRRGRELGRHRDERDLFDRSGPVAIYLFRDGAFTALSSSGAQVSDEALARAAAALPEGRDAEGLLDDFDLAWREEVSSGSAYVAFAEADFLPAWRRLVLVLALVELAALAAFFAIALLFSRWALRPVERAWAQQRQFVGDAAHDLKTPLAVILANSSILLEEPSMAEPDREKWLRSTQSEARGMQALVENMLATMGEEDAAGAPDADEAARTSAVDFSRVVQHGVLQFESVAFERGLALEGAVEEGISVAMGADDARRLVDVLLDNACKYADAGSVVRVSLEAVPPDRRNAPAGVRLAVANAGETIAPEDLPRLFDRFYRADAARTSQAGHGLGLSIAKALVEAAGGTISAQSEGGETTFFVELPRVESS